MEDKNLNVAVVGGGIAGLSCAHDLQKQGFNVEVFEESQLVGGRAPRAVRAVSGNDENILRLSEELGIDDQIEEMSLGELGTYKDGFLLKVKWLKPFFKPKEELSLGEKLMRKAMAWYSGIELESVDRLHREMEELSFDPFNRGEKNRELHEKTVQEWMNQYGEGVQEYILKPILQMTYDSDRQKMSADRGLYQIKKVFKMAEDGIYVLSGGPFVFSNTIRKELSRGSIKSSAKVTDVWEEENSTGLRFESEGEEHEKEFDYTVVATPLHKSSEILREDFNIEYLKSEYVMTEGNLKKGLKMVLNGESSYNLRTIFAADEEHFAYPRKEGEEIDLNQVYKGQVEILGREEIMTMPKIEAGSQIPGTEFGDRIMLAGDFMYYPSFETAAQAGKKAASKIQGKEE